MGVIHMNGRIYDPLIGRFMSADPIIQAPGNLQNYNRYSYVMNNPLNLTDPSGFSFWTRLMRLGDRISSVGISLGSTRIYNASVNFLQGSGGYQLKSAALSFVSAFCYAGASACNAGLQYGLAKGYGASESDAFKTGLIAGATTEGFTAAGGVGASDSLGRYAAHAAVGCASSVANGGGCGPGAAAALFGKFATNATAGWGVGVAQGAAAMVAGGVGSVIAGGKFENGAMTAAYGYLFNHMLSKGQVAGEFRKPGHHPFAKQWANDDYIGPRISEEAVFYAADHPIGGHIKWEGDHPNKWSNSTGHPEYNNGSGKQMVIDYMKEKGITPENPMNVKQMSEVIQRLNSHPFNASVHQYVNEQVKQGNVLMGRSMGRGAAIRYSND